MNVFVDRRRVLQSTFGCFTIVAALVVPSAARACSCGPLPAPIFAVQGADAVFRGTVLGIEDAPQWGKAVRFRVLEAWKGVSGAEVVIGTGRGGGDCGWDLFTTGAEFVVYAYEPGSFGHGLPLETDICTRTSGIDRAGDDLRFLRNPVTPGGSRLDLSRHGALQSCSSSPAATSGSGLVLALWLLVHRTRKARPSPEGERRVARR
jgi:hypothetical protein